MRLFKRIGIVGLGLIGGSIALAAKKKKIAEYIIGVSRHKETLSFARKIKAVDKTSRNLEVLREVDFVILACPVKAIIEISSKVRENLRENCLITDVGSTKEEIVSCLDKIFNYYLGSHPLAGSEKKGIKYANAELFKNSICILTPTPNTKDLVKKKLMRFWQALGMKILFLSPQEHDKILSLTSHLPHLLSFLVLNIIPSRYLRFCGSGLKDFVRLAGSDPSVWIDIFLSNQNNLISNLEEIEEIIKNLKFCLKRKDDSFLFKFIRKANLKYTLLR